jgi:hypothetical protein
MIATARLATVAAVLAVAGLSTAPPDWTIAARRSTDRQPSPRTRPDVIIVLTDQQRADAFGAGGAGDVRTPALDRLARQGMMFTKAFTATPQCSP